MACRAISPNVAPGFGMPGADNACLAALHLWPVQEPAIRPAHDLPGSCPVMLAICGSFVQIYSNRRAIGAL